MSAEPPTETPGSFEPAQDDRGSLRWSRGVLRPRSDGRARGVRGWSRSSRSAFPGILAYIILMFVMPRAGLAGGMTRPRILVTNDDGVFSEGIERLAAALAEVGDVFTVAPDQERSAAGHSLTLHHPLRAKLVGPQRWSVDGTPTDCVNWGVLHLLKDDRPKLLFSGINLGLNLGDDVTYSGTVSAAFEGTLIGISVGRDLAGDRDGLHVRRGRGVRGAPGASPARAAAAGRDARQRQRPGGRAARRARRAAGQAPLRRGGHREDGSARAALLLDRRDAADGGPRAGDGPLGGGGEVHLDDARSTST